MYDEHTALVENNTWMLVLKPPNANVVGIDCDDTFSLFVNPATIRIVLSLALSCGLHVHELDVKNAFLNVQAWPSRDPVLDPTLYRSLAGGLKYLTFTHPDISYAVEQICLYMHDPREPHLAALNHIIGSLMLFGVTAALIDVNATQSKLVLLENFNENYSKCLRLLLEVTTASTKLLLLEELTTARGITTAKELMLLVKKLVLLKDMDQDSAHMVVASKVPMLKPGEFKLWRMGIEQYIQMIDYALWEVIENGATLLKTQMVEGVMTVMPITSAEDKA
ncbi:ribonuclease H-like domain-containing protein [Tanacetum coccineum]